MPKNIVIFSDGTGQAGGVRPDQRLSNVYKLFRASRSGPDSPIDPDSQVAFYDAGLGTDDDAGPIAFRFARWLRKLLASVTGRGITRNITDCYVNILDNYDPGDRIFLFGFSRGAYTARCVANLLELCGVPALGRDGQPFPRRSAHVTTRRRRSGTARRPPDARVCPVVAAKRSQPRRPTSRAWRTQRRHLPTPQAADGTGW